MQRLINVVRWSPQLWILGLIVLLGGALRYYGVPNAENTDEYNEVIEALRIASGRLNYERWWKKGYQNILAVEYGVFFVAGYLLQHFSDPLDFAAKIIRNMDPLFLIGRYTTATLGTLSIVLTYAIGKRLFNERVGLIAAALFSVESINVWTSHLVNTDVPLTFFFLASFYFSVRFYQTGRLRDYAAAGALAGYAVSIKVIGVGACILIALFHALRQRERGEPVSRMLLVREPWYAAVAFVAGMIVGNPALVVGIHKFIAFHYGVYTNVYDEVPYASEGSGYYEYLKILVNNFGWPLCTTIVGAIGYAMVQRGSSAKVLVIYIVAMFAIVGGTTFLVQDRYLMILFPAVFLVVAKLLDDAAQRISGPGPLRNILLAGVCTFLLLTPFQRSLAFTRSLTEQNTSVVSREWIEQNIPAGSKILMDAGRTMITFGPRLNQSKAKLEEQLRIIKNLKEGETFDSPLVRIVDSYSAIYFELLLKSIPPITYDITSTELGRNVESPEFHKANGFEFYVHNATLRYRTDDPVWRAKYPKSARFYESFEQQFVLIKEFAPSETRSGDRIMIYRIQ